MYSYLQSLDYHEYTDLLGHLYLYRQNNHKYICPFRYTELTPGMSTLWILIPY